MGKEPGEGEESFGVSNTAVEEPTAWGSEAYVRVSGSALAAAWCSACAIFLMQAAMQSHKAGLRDFAKCKGHYAVTLAAHKS